MFYAIDLHSTTFMVAWKENGKVKTKQYRFTTGGLELFKKRLTKADIIAIESTINSYYFYEQLVGYVKEVQIINPKRFKVIYESASKTDKKDAKLILRFMEVGLLPLIKIPDESIRTLRGLFATYKSIKKSRTAMKNRLHGLLKSRGIFMKSADIFSSKGQSEIKANFQVMRIEEQFQAEHLLSTINFLGQKFDLITKEIQGFSLEYEKTVKLLTSIPGVGVLIALAIIADIGNIENFTNQKELCSYLGLAPKTEESNGRRKDRKKNAKGRKIARSMLSQAVFHYIKSNKVIEEFYEEKKKSKGSGKAIVAVMRKMMVVVYHMLKKNELYHHMKEEMYARKLNKWTRMIKHLRSLNKEEIDRLEHEGRLKYDPEYREKVIMRLKSA